MLDFTTLVFPEFVAKSMFERWITVPIFFRRELSLLIPWQLLPLRRSFHVSFIFSQQNCFMWLWKSILQQLLENALCPKLRVSPSHSLVVNTTELLSKALIIALSKKCKKVQSFAGNQPITTYTITKSSYCRDESRFTTFDPITVTKYNFFYH